MRASITAVALSCVLAQAADWPTVGGSPQRDGWAKSETAFTKENVKGLELLYKFKADAADQTLTTPMIVTRLITYLGFKEMLVFGGNSGKIYSVDADLNRLIWKAQLAGGTGPCGGLTAAVTMTGSSTAVVGGRGAVRPPPAAPGAASAPVRRPNRGGEFFAVGNDGNLHVLNTSTGADRSAPIPFVPPNSRVSALNVSDNVIYAATLDNCGGHADALFALDLSAAEPKVVSQSAQDGRIAGNAGTAIGSDGTVYTQVANVHRAQSDGVFALAPKTLEVKDYFLKERNVNATGTAPTPVVFSWKGSDLIAAAGADGRMYLLDGKSLGGTEHNSPLFETDSAPAGEFHGSFASWEDPANKERWIYGSAAHGVAGFRVEDRGGHPALVKAWVSGDIGSPSSPVVANGLVFTRGEGGLYALDAATGKTLYSSGTGGPAVGIDSGVAIANRRIYITGQDHTVYCFGFSAEQPQLTGK